MLVVVRGSEPTRDALGPDWPEFRGPTGQGLSTATNVPIHWSATSNVVWKTEIPGGGWSSPVISEGKIYLTTAVSEGATGDASLHALCLGGADGRVLWSTELFRPEAKLTAQAHTKNGLASPTPIVRDGRVYVHFGHMGTACLGVDGRKLWRTNAVAYSPVHGAASSPVLVDGLLVFGCDGAREPFLAALDARNGELRWRTPRNSTAKKTFSFATPLVISSPDGPIVVSPSSGFVGGYAAGNGQELWRVRYGEGYSVVPRPVYAQGLLFLSSGYDRPVFHAINPSGAKGDCTESHVAWTATRGAPNTPSAVALGDEVYTVSDAGIATCFEAKTGKIHWNERLGGDFSASPVAAEGRLYFVNEAGVGSVIAAGRSFRRLAVNVLGERTLASPAVADNALVIRTASHLWRIGR